MNKLLFLSFVTVAGCVTLLWFVFLFNYEKSEKVFFRNEIVTEKIEDQKVLKLELIKTEINIHSTVVPEQVERKLFNLSFEYLINSKVCDVGNKNIMAIILVTSYYSNVETRSAMRRAYSVEDMIAFDMRRVFLIAIPPESDKSVSPGAIMNESNRFGDLIQGNFNEAYRNLTYKHTMGLRWVTEFCPNAKYIIKMDDDIVVNIYRVSELMKKIPGGNKKIMAGYILSGMVPIREPANKWYVTKNEYIPSKYPDFLSGWFYITTPMLAQYIVQLTEKVPYFWIDDVYITGILAKLLNVKLLDLKANFAVHSEYLLCCMQEVKKHNYNCPVIVGPNGGDNNLFLTFNEIMSKCSLEKCENRPANKELVKTCIVEKKVNVGQGRPVIETVHLK